MKRAYVLVTVLLSVGLVAVAALAQAQAPAPAKAKAQDAAMKTSAVPQTPEWKQLLALVGTWEGTMEEGGQKMPATVDVRMTGDGSAIMHVLGKVRSLPHLCWGMLILVKECTPMLFRISALPVWALR